MVFYFHASACKKKGHLLGIKAAAFRVIMVIENDERHPASKPNEPADLPSGTSRQKENTRDDRWWRETSRGCASFEKGADPNPGSHCLVKLHFSRNSCKKASKTSLWQCTLPESVIGVLLSIIIG